jgi:hypothetical protein
MHKQREQKNDRQRNARKPEQHKAYYDLACYLLNNAALPVKFLEHCERKRVS